MMNGVQVVVASYGDPVVWTTWASRAAASVAAQTVQPDHVTVAHEPNLSLAAVRNGAVNAEAKWLIFLDADDTLDPRYVEAMLDHAASTGGDVLQPATRSIHLDGRVEGPDIIPKRELLIGNYVVVGALMSAALFRQVAGFRDLPIYEDWDLWLRMEEAGAKFTTCPDAIYNITVRPGSRNQQGTAVQNRWYATIKRDAMIRRR